MIYQPHQVRRNPPTDSEILKAARLAATEILKSNGLDPRTADNLERYSIWYVDTKALADLFDILHLPHRSEI